MNPISTNRPVSPGTPVYSGAPAAWSEPAGRDTRVERAQAPRAGDAGSSPANPGPGSSSSALGRLPPEIPGKITSFLHCQDVAALLVTGNETRGIVEDAATGALRKVFDEHKRVRDEHGAFAVPAGAEDAELTAAILNARTDQSLRLFKAANRQYLNDQARELQADLLDGNFQEGGAAALFLSLLGRNDEADHVARWALNRSGAGSSHMPLGRVLLHAGRCAEARQQFELGPRNPRTNSDIRLSQVFDGQFAAALNVAGAPCCATAMAHHSLGHHAQAGQIAGGLFPCGRAVYDAWRGDVEGTVRKLWEFIGHNGTTPMGHIFVHEAIARIRLMPIATDPRFLNFLESVYMAPAQLATIRFEVPDLR